MILQTLSLQDYSRKDSKWQIKIKMPILVMTLVASLEKEIFVVFVVLKKDQEIKSCEKKNYCSIFSRVRKISFTEKCFHTFLKIDSGNLFTVWIVVLDMLSLLRTLMLRRLHPPLPLLECPPPATQTTALEKEIHSLCRKQKKLMN